MGSRTKARHSLNSTMVDIVQQLDKIIDRGRNSFNLSDSQYAHGRNEGVPHIPLSALLAHPKSNNQTDVSMDTKQLQIRSLTEVTVLLLAYSIVVICSLFGNVLVCHVIFKNRRLHTVTNLFISNLAVSDVLITTLNIPFNIARNIMNEWVFGDFMCHFVNFILMVSVYVSTFTMASIAVDRYIVIMYPLRPRITFPIGIGVVVATWCVGSLMSLPFAIYAQVQDVELFLKTVARCRMCYPEPAETHEQYVTLFTVITQYFLPMILIALAYGQIVRKLWIRTIVGNPTYSQQINRDKIRRKTIKMLIIVVVIFCLCWMPLNLYHLLTDFHPDKDLFHYSSSVYLACHWLAMSSVCYNPFIYCWLNESFRAEMKSKLQWALNRNRTVHPGIDMDGILVRRERIPMYRRTFSNITSGSKSGGYNVNKSPAPAAFEQAGAAVQEEDAATQSVLTSLEKETTPLPPLEPLVATSKHVDHDNGGGCAGGGRGGTKDEKSDWI